LPGKKIQVGSPNSCKNISTDSIDEESIEFLMSSAKILRILPFVIDLDLILGFIVIECISSNFATIYSFGLIFIDFFMDYY